MGDRGCHRIRRPDRAFGATWCVLDPAIISALPPDHVMWRTGQRRVPRGQVPLVCMPLDGGPSGLMYILRGRALEVERGDSPDLSAIYAPGTWRQARRRLLAVWACSIAWIIGLALGGLVAMVALVVTFIGPHPRSVDAVRGCMDRFPHPPVDTVCNPGRALGLRCCLHRSVATPSNIQTRGQGA
jgi:hypothetical protein